jgi:transposase
MLSADRKDWRESVGLSRRIVRARRDYYRGAAKSIAARFVTIGIEKLSLAEMSTAENNPLPQAARYYRRVAASAEFLGAIKWAAAKAGSHVHEHNGPSSWICADCGHDARPPDSVKLIITCPNCSAVWDQDVNAARNLCAVAVASAPTAQKDQGALARAEQVESTALSGQNAGGRWARAKAAAALSRQRSQTG